MTRAYNIRFREQIDPALEYEISQKGWYNGAFVDFDGKTVQIEFYDPVTLSQQIESAFEHGKDLFFEKNLVVVEDISVAHMTRAIERLIETGEIDLLAVGASEAEADAHLQVIRGHHA